MKRVLCAVLSIAILLLIVPTSFIIIYEKTDCSNKNTFCNDDLSDNKNCSCDNLGKYIFELNSYHIISIDEKTAYAIEGETPDYSNSLDNIDLSPFDEFSDISNELFENLTFKEKVEQLLTGGGVDAKEYFNKILNLIFSNLCEMIPIMATVLGVVLLYGVLGIIKSGFLNEETKKVITMALVLSVMAVIMTFVTKLTVNAKEVMESLKSQMYVSFPVFLTLLFASGGTTSTATLQPILYFLSVVISDIITNVVLPLFLFSLAVNFLSSISSDVKFTKLAEFAKTLSMYIIGVSLTVFTAVISISGAFASGYDGVLYKTAKYAVGASVPIVGEYVKDGLDLVILTSVQIKNTVGIASLLLFLGTAISPILSIFVASLLLKGVGALAESFADEKIGGFLDKTAKGLETVGASLTAVTLMYMEAVFMVILSTNIIL